MLRKKIVLLFVLCVVGCADKKNEDSHEQSSSFIEDKSPTLPLQQIPDPVGTQQPPTQIVEEPTLDTPDEVAPAQDKETSVLLDHKFFQIKYLPKYRLPKFVRYELTAEHLRIRKAKRSNLFRLDTILIDLKIQPVLPHDYFRSDYDRGHMAPSADFLWDQKANDETFVMSNVAPQSTQLNTGAWLELEDRVRRWACAEERLIVIAGPILQANLRKMKSGVAIPQKFFKIILDDSPPRKAIGFIFSQDDQKNHLREIQISPDKIGQIIGEDFGPEFPQADRNALKATPSLSDWHEASCFREIHSLISRGLTTP